MVAQEMFEFYDFFLVGYLVSVLAPGWHLTYGQSAMMLLSSGVGAIAGSLVGGQIADRIGRKKIIWGGGVIFSLGALGCAMIPDGAWILFSVLRFVVGFGSTAAISAQSPADRRDHADPVPDLRFQHDGGAGRARHHVCRDGCRKPAAGDRLARRRRHRGAADRDVAPDRVDRAGIGTLAVVARPQRRRAARGRQAARRSRSQHHAAERDRACQKSGSLAELLGDQTRFWWVVVVWIGISTGTYGVILWGPTVLSQLLKITAHEAAHYFVYASIASMLGRVLFSVLPLYIGRRGAAIVGTFISVLVMLAISFFYREFIAGWSVFALLVIFGAAFYSGAFSNMSPYVVEAFPVSLGARAAGVSQAANGIGKILGPVCLALIAGSSDVVSPKATTDAIAPAFLFLAVCELAALVAIVAYRKEPHGKPIDIE